jgi:hypothetical protein
MALLCCTSARVLWYPRKANWTIYYMNFIIHLIARRRKNVKFYYTFHIEFHPHSYKSSIRKLTLNSAWLHSNESTCTLKAVNRA